jgi:osmotically-inducible protein OsmY
VRNDIRIILPRDGGQYDDGSIVAAIEVQLLCHPVFDIKKLRINSLKGNVRIGGTADEYWKRDGITRLVSSVGGITGLDNKIRIIPKQWQSDFNILRSIKETLHHQDKSSAEKIKLSVRAGCVHITGMVETASCFKMVEQIVEYTPGVCNVLNELMVK